MTSEESWSWIKNWWPQTSQSKMPYYGILNLCCRLLKISSKENSNLNAEKGYYLYWTSNPVAGVFGVIW